MKTDSEKIKIFDTIIILINDRREMDEYGELQFDSDDILEQIEILLND